MCFFLVFGRWRVLRGRLGRGNPARSPRVSPRLRWGKKGAASPCSRRGGEGSSGDGEKGGLEGVWPEVAWLGSSWSRLHLVRGVISMIPPGGSTP